MTSASRFANQARKQFTRVPSPDLSSGFMAAAGLREGRVLVPDFSLGYDSGPAGRPDRRGSTDPRGLLPCSLGRVSPAQGACGIARRNGDTSLTSAKKVCMGRWGCSGSRRHVWRHATSSVGAGRWQADAPALAW
jgi:hypothetical protein